MDNEEDHDRKLDKEIARRFLRGMSPEDVLEVVNGLLQDAPKPEEKP
jgi:hypothetical protein